MLELSPLLTAANAPARSIPAFASVLRSKPTPVTWSPEKSGPSRRKAAGFWSMIDTECPRRSRLRARLDPTRPQPMTTMCTEPTLPNRRRKVAAPPYDRAVSLLTRVTKRLVIGRPVRSDRLGEAALSKRIALPIFASDALSSVTYATQEILLVLSLAGVAFLWAAPWVAAAIVLLFAIVVASYRQVVRAYPSGGGDYEVATKNLGRFAGPDGRERAAGRLRADRRGVRLGRRRQHHLRVPGPQPRPGRHRAGPGRPARRRQPAGGARVRHGLRRPDVPVHRGRAGDDRHRPAAARRSATRRRRRAPSGPSSRSRATPPWPAWRCSSSRCAPSPPAAPR